MQRKVIQTSDGSTSLYIPELNEHYHSVHGAVQESMHVFIETGLKSIDKQDISIFEMGYGTGLNYLLTFLNANNRKINYTCIEAYPLEEELIQEINFTDFLNLNAEAKKAFEIIHSDQQDIKVSTTFELHKRHCKLNQYVYQNKVDLIYFDAFAPTVQPELWNEEVFMKMFEMLNPGGILTTYCAKGIVRRTMQSVGFSVERLPGPPGKREILRAQKIN